MWWLLMSKAFLFYESVIRNGSVRTAAGGVLRSQAEQKRHDCSIKGTEHLTAGIYQYNAAIWDQMLHMEPLKAQTGPVQTAIRGTMHCSASTTKQSCLYLHILLIMLPTDRLKLHLPRQKRQLWQNLLWTDFHGQPHPPVLFICTK